MSIEPEWQLIAALVRIGGIRCPSDVLALRWEWVSLPDLRLTVYSPKTDSFRVLPIFEELEPYLQAAWDRADDNAEHVVTTGRNKGDKTLYSAFKKRVLRANVPVWPNLFNSLRSTRETELLTDGRWPAHVVAYWMGHSVNVQNEHYAQVTDHHYSLATRSIDDTSTRSKRRSAQGVDETSNRADETPNRTYEH